MKIHFDKVTQTPKSFVERQEGVVFEGSLSKRETHRVHLIGTIEGQIKVQCDRCGILFDQSLLTPVKLTLSDQIVEDKEDLDIIEFLNGEIDISFILESEIVAEKSEYHYCSDCSKLEEAVEIEF